MICQGKQRPRSARRTWTSARSCTLGNNATLKNLTIRNGIATQGAGIFNYGGTLTLDHCTITNNHASGKGGGILNGVLRLSDTTLQIGANFGGTLVLKDCSVTQNISTNDSFSNSSRDRKQ